MLRLHCKVHVCVPVCENRSQSIVGGDGLRGGCRLCLLVLVLLLFRRPSELFGTGQVRARLARDRGLPMFQPSSTSYSIHFGEQEPPECYACGGKQERRGFGSPNLIRLIL